MTNQKNRDPEGRAVNAKGVAFADVLAAARRGEELDPIDVLEAQSWRIDNQTREIASLRKQLAATRSGVEPKPDPGQCIGMVHLHCTQLANHEGSCTFTGHHSAEPEPPQPDDCPELCTHDDSSWCTEECVQKARKVWEWRQNQLRGRRNK